MHNKKRADQVSGGVFLIGLTILFMLDGFWWPGIMFVIGASLIARTMAEGKPWQSATSAFWIIGIGVVFWLPSILSINFGNLWPLMLLAIGLFMLLGGGKKLNTSYDDFTGKRKNDDETQII